MKNSALLVLSFYLSKFGSKSETNAYHLLDFKNATEAFSSISDKLSIPQNTVKNYRDTFDPLHEHRPGWHQKPLQPRFKKISDSLKEFDEESLSKICKKILSDAAYRESEAYLKDLNIMNTENFEDLSQLYLELQAKAKKLESIETDRELPYEFKEKILRACSSKYEILFARYSAKLLVKKTSNKLVVPNVTFFMALEGLDYFYAVEDFLNTFNSICQRLRVNKKTDLNPVDLHAAINDPLNVDSIKKDFDGEANSYLKEIGKNSNENIERFGKFVYDADWSYAGQRGPNDGKSAGRGDTSRSPILKAFGVPHAEMGFIHSFVEAFGRSNEDFSEYSLLNGFSPKKSTFPKNLIVYGAPGTGKSYFLENLLKEAKTVRTVFHSETQNSDFVGSLKPATTEGKVTYEFSPGPFVLAFIDAIKDPNTNIFLIIEEINRANAAAVFGEIFQLLDRDANGRSHYVIHPDEQLSKYLKLNLGDRYAQEIYLPENLFLSATMNSSDQGVYPLDAAFKRRWSFKYMPIDFGSCANGKITIDERNVSWEVFASSINAVLKAEFTNLEEDRLIGQWFLSQNEVEHSFKEAIQSKVFTYLWNDVLRHHQKNKIFNDQYIFTFGDLVKLLERQFAGEKTFIFSDRIHAEFDKLLKADSMPIADTEASSVTEIKNDN